MVNGHRSYAHDSPGRACSAALGFLLQCDVCVCLLAQVHESTAQQGNKAIAHHLNMSSTNLELRIDILQGACVRIHGSKRKGSMSHPNLMQRGMWPFSTESDERSQYRAKVKARGKPKSGMNVMSGHA